jgi:hypothetical protein
VCDENTSTPSNYAPGQNFHRSTNGLVHLWDKNTTRQILPARVDTTSHANGTKATTYTELMCDVTNRAVYPSSWKVNAEWKEGAECTVSHLTWNPPRQRAAEGAECTVSHLTWNPPQQRRANYREMSKWRRRVQPSHASRRVLSSVGLHYNYCSSVLHKQNVWHNGGRYFPIQQAH